MKNSPARAAGVTFALLAAGAIFGAVAASLGVLVAVGLTDGLQKALALLGVSAAIGGVLGVLLLPATSWILLRRVPLGAAWLGTAAGALVGGIAGWLAAILLGGDLFLWPFGAAVAGFFLAVVWLRLRFRAAPQRVAVE